MQLIFEDKQKRIIETKEKIEFPSFSSYHLIVVNARAKSEKQLGQQVTDDEDLTVKIDNKTFPKLNSGRLKDSPAAFSGGRLHGLAKTVYFLTFLKGKDHEIALAADTPPHTATLETIKVYTLTLEEKTTLDIDNQAEDGDRRPWITFVLDNLPLKLITPTITYSRRKTDSDDVKVKVDNKTQGNLLRNIKHFLWRFIGSFLPWSSPSKRETEAFSVNLPQELHYIEFDADRMPSFNKLIIDFGEMPTIPEGIPTVDNPKWAGDFYDDPPEILLARLIFGEARNQSKEAKVGVAWTVKNRLLARRSYFGFNYHEVILKHDDGNYQFAPMNPNDSKNFPALTDPLGTQEQTTRTAWLDSYQVAVAVIRGPIPDSTEGAVFFHSSDLSQEEFVKKYVPGAIFIKQIGDLLFYKSAS